MLKNITSITLLLIIAALICFLSCGCQRIESWKWERKLNKELKLMGHRNWIVVADSAYPVQNKTGIETIATSGEQLETIRKVWMALEKAKHVRLKIYLDVELDSVSESDAPGIEVYRRELKNIFQGWQIHSIAHEELIAKLDEAAETFKILIIKTDIKLPYTSVFLELDCGYWNEHAEKRLRETMRQ
jgi:D-ribose pyranose/furanose isomerase RbsD